MHSRDSAHGGPTKQAGTKPACAAHFRKGRKDTFAPIIYGHAISVRWLSWKPQIEAGMCISPSMSLYSTDPVVR
jgi:hypothetical protein